LDRKGTHTTGVSQFWYGASFDWRAEKVAETIKNLPKDNCLFQQRLDSLQAIGKWAEFYVQQHNEVMPHQGPSDQWLSPVPG
jgi:hypothetical protein